MTEEDLKTESKIRQNKFCFKVGDTVKVHRPLCEKERDVYPDWVRSMDDTDGQCGKIESISSDGTCSVKFVRSIPGSPKSTSTWVYAIKWVSYAFEKGDAVKVTHADPRYDWDGVVEDEAVSDDGTVEIRCLENNKIYYIRDAFLIPKKGEEKMKEEEKVEEKVEPLSSKKFSVGQEVRARRPSSPEERKSSPQWVDDMDAFDGLVGKVQNYNRKHVVVKFPISWKQGRNTWNFKESWLESFVEEKKEELSEQAKEDLAHEKEFGLLINFKNGDLPLYQQLVFEFSGSLEIREHAFNDAGELLEGYKSCHWSKPESNRTDEKKKKIVARINELKILNMVSR